MLSASEALVPQGDSRLIAEFLPGDMSRQTHSSKEAVRALDTVARGHAAIRVLDLGCGVGTSHDELSAHCTNLQWIGLDIGDSREVIARPRRRLPFCTYDGTRIPLADASIDFIYSKQVFEHVRYPEILLADAYRVLKPNGVFVGSTSHLEPFHSRSYWNYTPYGFCVLLRDAGFNEIQIRPGIDAMTLIARRCFSYVRLSGLCEPFFTTESPVNLVLEYALRMLRQSARRRNQFKLLFAGQFCFIARK